MDVLTAKKLVIEAGERLVETGLIARTWGNVSCRVDDKTFVITPSGKPYIGLTPDDIVEVAINTLEWGGNVKPSSEKGIHAEVYKEFPEANFVIHTHQKVASAISAISGGIEKVVGDAGKLIGGRIYLGSYGLPGTKKLKKGVTKALRLSPSKAVIMAHHGALCFGKDSEEAFQVANSLEQVCTKHILDSAKDKLGIKSDNLDGFCTEMADKLTKSQKTVEIDPSLVYNSVCNRDSGEIVFTNKGDGSEMTMELNGASAAIGEFAEVAIAHKDIYLAYPTFNNIIHNTSSEVVAVSRLGKTMKPLIDDFAQICGPTVKCASPNKCVKALKRKNAVLIKDMGALCCGSNEGDAQAVDMIMSKSSLALLTSKVFGKEKAINPVEAWLMRIVYLTKYSKKASE
ncbi:MAG: class II aldolase/adducin family protein [Ruminococcaceae bacterium]|nr:class II aldolase/adducin family protein [Oscillospiraceae bacterium]